MLISQQFADVARALPVNYKVVVSQLAPPFLEQSRMLVDSASLRRAAVAAINRSLPGLPAAEVERLIFYLLALVLVRLGKAAMSVNEAVAERDRLTDQKDSISEMGQQDMLLLQQMMEKKGQLESMISNCMKAAYEGGQAAISSLKAS